ncbi:MAG: TIGR04255 family protein [Deltaproteobacteria bacterium]|jgi:uncharacterized protein (TIGR04255 family)|nr:TIGR04255 family protein [Deltaproteobacteria bacterium]
MSQKVPISLKNSPIIENVFEIRYIGDIQVPALLPGILRSSIEGKMTMLPVPPIPLDFLRDNPNMQMIPSFSLKLDNYIIVGNPHYVAISVTSRYNYWKEFKKIIIDIHNILFKTKLIEKVKRYSIKYINLTDVPSSNNTIDLLNINININNKILSDEKLSIRIESPSEEFFNVIEVSTSATVYLNHNNIQDTKTGLLINIDTIKSLQKSIEHSEFINNIASYLYNIHE